MQAQPETRSILYQASALNPCSLSCSGEQGRTCKEKPVASSASFSSRQLPTSPRMVTGKSSEAPRFHAVLPLLLAHHANNNSQRVFSAYDELSILHSLYPAVLKITLRNRYNYYSHFQMRLGLSRSLKWRSWDLIQSCHRGLSFTCLLLNYPGCC